MRRSNRTAILGILRATLVSSLLVVLLLGAFPTSASAETVAELKARLEAVQAKYQAAGNAVDQALDKLEETDDAIAETQDRRESAAKELRKAQKALRSRASLMYRSGAVAPLAMLIGASSFEDFVSRYDFLKIIGTRDAKIVANVKDKRAKLAAEEKRLRAQRDARASDLSSIKDRRAALESKLNETRGEYDAARVALAKARAARSSKPVATPASNSGVVVSAGANGMVFPVAGACYYDDTWGEPRSGGRTHQGTDIMASTGTPVVAVTSGYVNAKTNGLGGKTIWLSGEGYDFYYAHLDGWAVTDGHVKAGQVIGYVGSTGNASGGAPHLHFEMHPGGGDATNPYPYLKAMQ